MTPEKQLEILKKRNIITYDSVTGEYFYRNTLIKLEYTRSKQLYRLNMIFNSDNNRGLFCGTNTVNIITYLNYIYTVYR